MAWIATSGRPATFCGRRPPFLADSIQKWPTDSRHFFRVAYIFPVLSLCVFMLFCVLGSRESTRKVRFSAQSVSAEVSKHVFDAWLIISQHEQGVSFLTYIVTPLRGKSEVATKSVSVRHTFYHHIERAFLYSVFCVKHAVILALNMHFCNWLFRVSYCIEYAFFILFFSSLA